MFLKIFLKNIEIKNKIKKEIDGLMAKTSYATWQHEVQNVYSKHGIMT